MKDVALIAGGLGALSAMIIASVALIVSLTVAPMREDMRLMRQDTQHGFEAVDEEFKAVRKDLAALRDRLKRVEMLLERDAGRTRAPEPPATDTE